MVREVVGLGLVVLEGAQARALGLGTGEVMVSSSVSASCNRERRGVLAEVVVIAVGLEHG